MVFGKASGWHLAPPKLLNGLRLSGRLYRLSRGVMKVGIFRLLKTLHVHYCPSYLVFEFDDAHVGSVATDDHTFTRGLRNS